MLRDRTFGYQDRTNKNHDRTRTSLDRTIAIHVRTIKNPARTIKHQTATRNVAAIAVAGSPETDASSESMLSAKIPSAVLRVGFEPRAA